MSILSSLSLTLNYEQAKKKENSDQTCLTKTADKADKAGDSSKDKEDSESKDNQDSPEQPDKQSPGGGMVRHSNGGSRKSERSTQVTQI